MAYIDVETEKADFRVILGSHTRFKKMNPAQIPGEATALMIEGLASSAAGWSHVVESGGYSKAFTELIDEGRRRNIPITAADPATDIDKEIEVFNKELAAVGAFLITKNRSLYLKISATPLFLDLSTREIDRDGWIYKSHREYNALLKANGFSGTSFRDMVMARRALRFADYQRARGMQRPYVALACGGMHMGIADLLSEDPKTLDQQIRSHIDYAQYFSAGAIGRVAYSQFDSAQSTWRRGAVS